MTRNTFKYHYMQLVMFEQMHEHKDSLSHEAETLLKMNPSSISKSSGQQNPTGLLNYLA